MSDDLRCGSGSGEAEMRTWRSGDDGKDKTDREERSVFGVLQKYDGENCGTVQRILFSRDGDGRRAIFFRRY